MKLKNYIVPLVIVFLFVGCSKTPLLRYGNRASCLGHFNSGIFQRGYHFPVQASHAKISIQWHNRSGSFLLMDQNGNVHYLNESSQAEIQQINYDQITQSSFRSYAVNNDSIAFTVRSTGSSDILIFPMGKEGAEEQPFVIDRASRPIWHPSERLLASIDEGEQPGSNIVVIYDLAGSSPVLANTYKMKSINISELIGWSNDGQVIALSQYDSMGLIPYYLFPKDGEFRQSLFNTSRFNCVMDGQWSPTEQELAFSGENETTAGWDIFLEKVTSKNRDDWALTNLTKTPNQDERNASWSPDGNQIIYMSGYEDRAGNLVQELMLVNPKAPGAAPIQLTDTSDEYETSPMWISNTKIAYLSWKSTEQVWTLNTLTIEDFTHQIVMEIPELWYQKP